MATRGRLLILHILAIPAACAAGGYFQIRVVDEQTGRGVPLVELRTVGSIRYYTDSAGLVAFREPGLTDREVFFAVSSDGYEYPADGFGYRGTRLEVRPGGEATLKVRRLNIAERLYRVTGGGIYRDSVLLGQPAPIREPLINGDVLGQDSVQNVIYGGKLYWFWGDTNRPQYPLGNFHMAGATSVFPSHGGLDPAAGVNLTYFVRDDGFAKEMAPRPEPGPVWLDSFVTLPDGSGRERMYAAYARVTGSMEAVERGFMEFNDERQVFEKLKEFSLLAPTWPSGHPFVQADGGVEYIWFPAPFPLVRVRAEARAFLDTDQYEAWTPLEEGRRLDAPALDRDDKGNLRYAWRRNTPALDQRNQNQLIESGAMKPDEAWIHLQDADTGKLVMAHAGSVYWNDHRRRWITIRCESFGSSMLGETWYAEADTPLGPWVYARKIVTHRRYSFYNPRQHPEFDQDGGRLIYFEGTYTSTFSGNPEQTPRYDYNQIMYRLDLADQRLILPVPVYRMRTDDATRSLATRNRLPVDEQSYPIAFFALDRPAAGALAVRWSSADGATPRLMVTPAEQTAPQDRSILFYALPADVENPPPTTVPLFEFRSSDPMSYCYAVDPGGAPARSERAESPICRVWRNPTWTDWRWPQVRRR